MRHSFVQSLDRACLTALVEDEEVEEEEEVEPSPREPLVRSDAALEMDEMAPFTEEEIYQGEHMSLVEKGEARSFWRRGKRKLGGGKGG